MYFFTYFYILSYYKTTIYVLSSILKVKMKKTNNNISSIHNEYKTEGINDNEIEKTPFPVFKKWLNEAISRNLPEPNAMHLSTVSSDGKPSGRIVLLKDFNENGFIFYTNYESRKGLELKLNNNASLNFFWPQLFKQIRIEGSVEKVTRKESNDYFQNRPRGSQIAAIASRQSKILNNRLELDNIVEKLILEYKNKPIKTPKNWGGYLLKPERIEFWQGRENRLHDRVCYISNKSKSWDIVRLFP